MIGKRLLLTVAGAAFLGLGALSVGSIRMAGESEPAGSEDVCCFNNPAYSGTCRVEPAEDETCASILAYLNNPMGQGKSYCEGTKVRQGWQQVTCDETASLAADVTTPRRGCDPR